MIGQPRGAIAPLVLLLTFGSGCTSVSGAAPLEAFSGCPWNYPDGTPVDCTQDMATSVSEGPPPLARCLEEIDAGPKGEFQKRVLKLWTDDAGNFAIEYDVTPLKGQYYGRMELTVGSETHTVLFRGSPHSHVLFAGMPTDASLASYEAEVRRFTSEGSKDPLTDKHLRMLVTTYERQPWYLWAFQAEGERFTFQSMSGTELSGATFWNPTNAEWRGQDFGLRVTTDRPISARTDVAIDRPLNPLEQSTCGEN